MQPDTKRQEVLRLIRSYQRGEVIEADAPKTNPFILGRKAAEAGIAPTLAWCERMLRNGNFLTWTCGTQRVSGTPRAGLAQTRKLFTAHS